MEEFSSNESGWTKYLGSPSVQEENYSSGVEDVYYNYYNGRDRESHYGGVKHKENEDDDSTASDASSGPRSHGVLSGRGINGGGCSSKCSADDEDEEYYYGKRFIKGEMPCKEAKGKAGKVSSLVSKTKGALKQKRGKKAN